MSRPAQAAQPSCQLTRVIALVLGLVGLLLLWPRALSAHELEIDQFFFFPSKDGSLLIGQIIFDPELTRKPDSKLSPEQAKGRVLDFVQNQLTITIDGTRCKPKLEIRELYDGSGATAGDSVGLTCPLNAQIVEHQLTAQVGDQLGDLMVKGPSLSLGGKQEEVAELTASGHTSPVFRFVAAPDSNLAERAEDPKESPDRLQTSLRPFYEVLFVYLKTGFRHILPLGMDHVLFVIGVVLGAARNPRLFRNVGLQLTGFTIAHTLTLALVAFGTLATSSAWVEPLIALSIALLGAETLFLGERWQRYRLAIVFFFGLVHGMGFAGALRESNPEIGSFIYALLGFDLGVELGQFVVAAALVLPIWVFQSKEALREQVIQAGSWTLLLIGLYWTASRLL